MFKFEKHIPVLEKRLVVSFDLEWTKNYRIKNGNLPFCFSFVYFPFNAWRSESDKQLEFGVYLRYVDHKNEIPDLLREADKILGRFFCSHNQTTVVGHQLSSDISIVLNSASEKSAVNFLELKKIWKTRKDKLKSSVEVFDSRYDMNALLKEKSRRLVDVCQECGLDVTQPEIKSSMTKMQNDYYLSGDKKIMERLSILNIRHSLSAAILFLIYKKMIKEKRVINVNHILSRGLSEGFNYLREEDFLKLL